MAEMSDAQYECLVGLLADNRVAVTDLGHQLTLAEAEWKKRFTDLHIGLNLQGETLSVMEQDLSRVQGDIRSMAQCLTEHTQALDGITQLSKTNFDLLESHQQHHAGQSSSIDHDRAVTPEQAQ